MRANEPTKRGFNIAHWILLVWDIGPAGKFPSFAGWGSPFKLLVHRCTPPFLSSHRQARQALGKHPPKAAPLSGHLFFSLFLPSYLPPPGKQKKKTTTKKTTVHLFFAPPPPAFLLFWSPQKSPILTPRVRSEQDQRAMPLQRRQYPYPPPSSGNRPLGSEIGPPAASACASSTSRICHPRPTIT